MIGAWGVYYTRSLKRWLGFKPSPTSLMGKRVIAGLRIYDASGVLIEQFQVHGRVSDLGPQTGILLTLPGGGRFTLPPSLGWLQPARPGEYRLRSTGDVVIDPDYVMETRIDGSSAERIAELKARGFADTFSS